MTRSDPKQLLSPHRIALTADHLEEDSMCHFRTNSTEKSNLIHHSKKVDFLSDTTEIKVGIAWSDLKSNGAMSNEYRSTYKYAALSPDDKVLTDKLIVAQTEHNDA